VIFVGLGRKFLPLMRQLVLLLSLGCTHPAQPSPELSPTDLSPTDLSPPDLSPPPGGRARLFGGLSWSSTPAVVEGPWVVSAPGSVDKGVILTHEVLSVGDNSFSPLIALDIHDGAARTWDGHREGTAVVRVSGNELELTTDRDDPSYRWCHQISAKDGKAVVDGGRDPRVHRYPDFVSARAAVDEDVMAQDPIRLMARYGGKIGDTSTVAGVIATHLARPRSVDGRRVRVRGVIVELWTEGLALAPPGVVTPTIHCSLAGAADRFRLFQTVTASGIVSEGIDLALTFRGVNYRGDARGVTLDECQVR
jgi:hypothetical protein